MSTLSLAMIVKDEGARLGRCLGSVRDLVDEMVVVDTGSTDDTVAVAQANGARTGAFPWRDDFAAARNESLRLCTCDWVLVLDADEAVDRQDHGAIRRAVDQGRAAGFTLVSRNYTRDGSARLFDQPVIPNRSSYQEGAGLPFYADQPMLRLVRRFPDLRFDGRTHASLTPYFTRKGLATGALEAVIHHYGKLDGDKERAKSAYYLELARREAADCPEDPDPCLVLGDLEERSGQVDRAREAMRAAIDRRPGDPRLRQALVELALRHDQPAQAAADAMEALRALPGEGGGQWHTLAAGFLLKSGHAGPGKAVLDLGLAAFPEHPGLQGLAAALAGRREGGMKFNMGCGKNKLPGYTNVDQSPVCRPDQVADLETVPWPWPDDCAEEVVFCHSLEHMGGDPKVFLAIMRELYRVCRPDALVVIRVPHPRHDNFIGDPTHVRAINPQMMSLFSRAENDRWARTGASNTPLAHYLGVDFELTASTVELEEPYRTELAAGRMSAGQVQTALREKNNVGVEYRMELRVRKASR